MFVLCAIPKVLQHKFTENRKSLIMAGICGRYFQMNYFHISVFIAARDIIYPEVAQNNADFIWDAFGHAVHTATSKPPLWIYTEILDLQR